MKPRDSSEEVEGGAGEARADATNLAAARLPADSFPPGSFPPAGAARSASGVVAAPAASSAEEEDEDKTTVDHGGLPLSGEQQAALARRIRTALQHTLPLGTPVPHAVGPSRVARSAYARTMLLAGRPLPGIAIAPGALLSEEAARLRAEASRTSELVTPPVPVPAVAPAPAPARSEPVPSDTAAVRASFVRPVGPPTVPPPRRSRRPGAYDREPGSEPEHEAFALERPRAAPSDVPALTRRGVEALSVEALSVEALSAKGLSGGLSGTLVGMRRGTGGTAAAPRPLSQGVMLPPPPQPGDYDPPSSPASATLSQSWPGETEPPALSRASRVTMPPLLSDLPSANPFEGFEAPRESWARRSVLVLVVALAVVGLCAIAAIALGFLGKTPHW